VYLAEPEIVICGAAVHLRGEERGRVVQEAAGVCETTSSSLSPAAKSESQFFPRGKTSANDFPLAPLRPGDDKTAR